MSPSDASVLQEILQRSVSVEDQRQGALCSRAPSKSTFNELLDTLKLLEEEPQRLSQPKCYSKDKYAWIDEVTLPEVSTSSSCGADHRRHDFNLHLHCVSS